MKKVSLYFLSVIVFSAMIFTFSSCGDSEEEPVKAPADFSYPATSVQVGATGDISPSSTADGATYDFANKSAVPDFISLNPSTGVISVGEESTTGEYTVDVKAVNTAGSATGSATITITVPDDFNPVGLKLLPMYFVNQTDGLELYGLNGVPDLPVDTLQIPVGWLTDQSTPMDSLGFMALTGIGQMLWEVPVDNTCDDYKEPIYVVNDDLTLSAVCAPGTDPSAAAGSVLISYKDGGYVFTMSLKYDDAIPAISYPIGGATIGSFDDPFVGVSYEAIRGICDAFTMPSDYSTEDAMKNAASWIRPKVEIVIQVVTDE